MDQDTRSHTANRIQSNSPKDLQEESVDNDIYKFCSCEQARRHERPLDG